jgi:hypothetical protein
MGVGCENTARAAIDPRQVGTAFVCVRRHRTAANCKTRARCSRSLQVAVNVDFGLAPCADVVQDGRNILFATETLQCPIRPRMHPPETAWC